jgi:hypothetical protein
MKIAIGMNVQSGPHGGGNRFGASLIRYLKNKGYTLYSNLNEPDLDLILLTEPRRVAVSSFSHVDVARYLRRKNPQAIVMHRINECDERKGTLGLNRYLMRANRVADVTIFISSWLRNLFLDQGYRPSESHVILNGADASIFRSPSHFPVSTSVEPLRLVTHHWGANKMKGFDVYEQLDSLLGNENWKSKIALTYIGNLPKGVKLSNSKVLAPLNGKELAEELGQHHVYITGSLNEPAGMHHIEGALCGLPLIYRKSGALPEYCDGYGLGFDRVDELWPLIQKMRNEYSDWKFKMGCYNLTAEKMCENYFELFEKTLTRREEILVKQRKKNARFFLWEPVVFKIFWALQSRIRSQLIN